MSLVGQNDSPGFQATCTPHLSRSASKDMSEWSTQEYIFLDSYVLLPTKYVKVYDHSLFASSVELADRRVLMLVSKRGCINSVIMT